MTRITLLFLSLPKTPLMCLKFRRFVASRQLISDQEPEILIRQGNALEALKQVKISKTTGFIAHNVAIQKADDTLVYFGRELSDVLLINFYSRGLHETVFQDVKRDLLIPSKDIEKVHNRFEGVKKSYYDEDAINILSASTGEGAYNL